MKVTLCVDALQPQLSGIGRYTLELCQGLPRSPEIKQLHHYSRGRLFSQPADLLSSGPQRRGNTRVGQWWRQHQAARALSQSDLVHAPNYFLPPTARNGVITVHDLSIFRYPETHPEERVAAFAENFGDSLVRTRHVITDTQTVRKEIIDEFRLPPDRVTAIPLGVDAAFRPRSEQELAPVLAGFGLRPRRYGLSVSTLEPRKRIEALIDSWERLPRSLRESTPLVLAGGSGWRNERLQKRIATAESEGWLINLGFVDEAFLPFLYAGAAVFSYPSIYEGFGLPPLEALASGVPVLVAPRSCLPEVCGEAALYADPDDDREGFRSSLERSLTDEDWIERCAQQGPRRAQLFSWDRCVSQTVDAYRKVTGGA